MLPFGLTILLMYTMKLNLDLWKKDNKWTKLNSPLPSLPQSYELVQGLFNKEFELVKGKNGFEFLFKGVSPYEMGIVINKMNIISITNTFRNYALQKSLYNL